MSDLLNYLLSINNPESKMVTQLLRGDKLTELTPAREWNFRDWYNNYAKQTNQSSNPNDKEHYYDYRGYYNKSQNEPYNPNLQMDNRMHLTDEFKQIGHPAYWTQLIPENYSEQDIQRVNQIFGGGW